MAALINTRQELFCQNLAKGMTEVAAYEAASFARDLGNACHLATGHGCSVEVSAQQFQMAAE